MNCNHYCQDDDKILLWIYFPGGLVLKAKAFAQVDCLCFMVTRNVRALHSPIAFVWLAVLTCFICKNLLGQLEIVEMDQIFKYMYIKVLSDHLNRSPLYKDYL